jgi:multiple sugar transport system substrate-binding protein
MKRALYSSIIGVFLALTGVLYATEPVELTFWHGIESPESVRILEEKIALFEKQHPDIRIRAQNYGAADQVSAKIMIAVAGRLPPDLMWWAPAFTGRMAKTGKIVKIGDLIARDPDFDAADIYDGLWDVSRYKGEIWTAPFDANNLALYYNKDHLAAAGIDPQSINTWTDLLAAAKKLTTPNRYGFQIPMGKNEWTVWVWQTFLWQAGGEFLTEKDNWPAPAFNSPAGEAALDYWVDFVHTHHAANFSEPDAGYKTDDFIAGRISMMVNGPWNYGALKQAARETGLNYGALFLPAAGPDYAPDGSGRRATNIGGENLFIFKSDSAREQAAWEFAKFVMSPDFQVDWAIRTGYLPVCRSAQQSPAYQQFLADNPFIKVFADQMQYGRARPSIPQYRKISRILGKQIERALYQKKSANAALQDAAASSTRILNKGRRR